jgi:hypothetical protein
MWAPAAGCGVFLYEPRKKELHCPFSKKNAPKKHKKTTPKKTAWVFVFA